MTHLTRCPTFRLFPPSVCLPTRLMDLLHQHFFDRNINYVTEVAGSWRLLSLSDLPRTKDPGSVGWMWWSNSSIQSWGWRGRHKKTWNMWVIGSVIHSRNTSIWHFKPCKTIMYYSGQWETSLCDLSTVSVAQRTMAAPPHLLTGAGFTVGRCCWKFCLSMRKQYDPRP